MNMLGIIPARGGSKSIPRKTIKKILGKPLIAWTIEAALLSNINRIFVSTDNPEIKELSLKYGAEAPFLRPKELSNDSIGIEPVIKHTLDWLVENENYTVNGIVLLMPTAPIKPVQHINKMIQIFKEKDFDSVVAVREVIANDNPYWMLKEVNNQVRLFTGEPLTKIKTRRQELPVCYSRNDVAYVFKPKNLSEKIPNLYGEKVKLYLMDEFYDVDINTPGNWLYCEHRLKLFQKMIKENKPLP